MPLDRRSIRKLEIPADQNVWRAPLILIVTRRNRVEVYLKDLAANRISAINKLSVEGKGHGFPERPSDGGHEACRLQPRRPAAVRRCSVWLGHPFMASRIARVPKKAGRYLCEPGI